MQQQRSSSDVLEVGTRVDYSTHGRPARTQPRGNAYAAEALATRGPLDRMDAAGNALTEDLPVDADTGSFGAATPSPAAGPVEGKARVRATEARPLHTLRPSSEDQLVELLPATAPAADAIPVTKRYGSLDAPYDMRELELDALFIGGRPHVEDVRQGSLGTCYLLADLLSVASADPAHIQGMITVRGGTAMVLFHRYDEQAQRWLPTPVVVDAKLARDAQNPGALVGAGFRVSEEPVSAAWHAEVNQLPDGNELLILRRAVHEAALWAPLIERAYARFSEMYGQYGGHPAFTEDEKHGGSGYDAVESGFASAALRVLYGEGVEDTELSLLGGTRKNLVIRNVDLVKTLLSVSAGETFASASIEEGKLPERLYQMLLRAVRGGEVAPEQLAACNAAIAAADIARTTLDLAPLVPFAKALVDIVLANVGGELGRARDIALVVLNTGKTTGGQRRSVYANHAYAVLGATFRGQDGEDLTIGDGDIPARLGDIDGALSTVKVRNPHGEGEVDRDGAGPADGRDDGAFELTLERFLTVFSRLDMGTRR